LEENKSKEKSSEQSKQIDSLAVDWTLANNAAANWALRYVGRLVRLINDTTRQRIQVEVANFIQNQENIGQLKNRLAPLFGEERAHMIAVTETTRAFAEGNEAAWKESGVTEGKRWNTNTDELVCPLCGPLHGEIVPLNSSFSDGTDRPPRHPRCRCWETPIAIIAEAAPADAVFDPDVPGQFVAKGENNDSQD